MFSGPTDNFQFLAEAARGHHSQGVGSWEGLILQNEANKSFDMNKNSCTFIADPPAGIFDVCSWSYWNGVPLLLDDDRSINEYNQLRTLFPGLPALSTPGMSER
jgi:hypothetical protein